MKAIKKELGLETNQKSKDLLKLKKKYDLLKLEGEAKEVIENELEKLAALEPHSPEYSLTYNYLETVISLPWNHFIKENHDLNKAKKTLESSHYGLKDVNERILDF